MNDGYTFVHGLSCCPAFRTSFDNHLFQSICLTEPDDIGKTEDAVAELLADTCGECGESATTNVEVLYWPPDVELEVEEAVDVFQRTQGQVTIRFSLSRSMAADRPDWLRNLGNATDEVYATTTDGDLRLYDDIGADVTDYAPDPESGLQTLLNAFPVSVKGRSHKLPDIAQSSP